MFVPVKADFPLPRFPALTLLVGAICIVVFTFQLSAWEKYYQDNMRYCASQERSRLTEMVFNQIAVLNEVGKVEWWSKDEGAVRRTFIEYAFKN